jgi:hypothetical protein
MFSRYLDPAGTSTSGAISSFVETCPEASRSSSIGFELLLASAMAGVFPGSDIAFVVVRVVWERNDLTRTMETLHGQKARYRCLFYSHILITPSLTSVELT